MSLPEFVAGHVIVFTGTFENTATGALGDPTTVTFKYSVSQSVYQKGATNTIAYGAATVPAPGVVARTAVGTYVAEVDSTLLAGFWTYEFLSTGNFQAVGPPPGQNNIQVAATPL